MNNELRYRADVIRIKSKHNENNQNKFLLIRLCWTTKDFLKIFRLVCTIVTKNIKFVRSSFSNQIRTAIKIGFTCLITRNCLDSKHIRWFVVQASSLHWKPIYRIKACGSFYVRLLLLKMVCFHLLTRDHHYVSLKDIEDFYFYSRRWAHNLSFYFFRWKNTEPEERQDRETDIVCLIGIELFRCI